MGDGLMGVQKITQEQHLRQWAEQVQNCRESGKSVSAWCEENGIKKSTYYRRQRMVAAIVSERMPVLQKSGDLETMQVCNTPAFAEYSLPISSSEIAITLHLSCGTIEIHNGADEAVIASTLRAMKSLC